jgi:predicted phage terminase large subunit-like protein
MFQRAWFTRERGQLLDRMPHPADVLFRVRAYDLAATPKKTNEQRAATVALRMAVLRSRLLVVEHVRRLWGRPHEVEQMMKELAVSDDAFHGGPVLVSFPIDPGQSGIAQRDQLAKVLEGHSWRATPETGDKVDRAKPPSASAEGKRLAIVKGDWNEEFLREALDFPFGKLKDQIDALSRAHRECTRGGGAATARAGGGDGKRVSMHRPGGGF